MKLHYLLTLSSLAVSTAWCQEQRQLTARELFFSTPPSKRAEAAKPAQPPAAQAKAQGKGQPAKQAAKSQPSPAKATPATPATPPARPSASIEAPPSVEFVQASYEGLPPLGLRYSILKYAGDDDYIEVDPDTVFRSGDRIRIGVETNNDAYLYIVMRGSSGTWKLVFPSSEIDEGDNRVRRGRSYEIPRRSRFVFDEQPGEEKLFLVLSRTPEPDLESLIYSLSSGRQGATPPAEPAKKKGPEKQKKVMLAQNSVNIGDDLVSGLRGKVMARDLVFEKVTDETPGEKKEKALYVVDPSGDPDSRLVVDVKLQHR